MSLTWIVGAGSNLLENFKFGKFTWLAHDCLGWLACKLNSESYIHLWLWHICLLHIPSQVTAAPLVCLVGTLHRPYPWFLSNFCTLSKCFPNPHFPIQDTRLWSAYINPVCWVMLTREDTNVGVCSDFSFSIVFTSCKANQQQSVNVIHSSMH
jgi:hypothetical protein